MANYFEYSVRDVTDTEAVGVGTGQAPDGSVRICVALEGVKVNANLAPMYSEINWSALTADAAKQLYELLTIVRHLWEVKKVS